MLGKKPDYTEFHSEDGDGRCGGVDFSLDGQSMGFGDGFDFGKGHEKSQENEHERSLPNVADTLRSRESSGKSTPNVAQARVPTAPGSSTSRRVSAKTAQVPEIPLSFFESWDI